MKGYCIDCGKELSYFTYKRCRQCDNNYRKTLKGKDNNHYKDGHTLKTYYCKDCLKQGVKTKISWQSGYAGSGRCRSCARKYEYIVNPNKTKGKNNPMYGNFCTNEQKEQFSNLSKKLWQNPEFREKNIKATLEAQKNTPNKPEKVLIRLLNKILPGIYTFVGDGKLIVGGFCPDFVNKDSNKIIEVFGCYWHKCKECGFGNGRPKDVGRLKEYKKLGYHTLIIWEHELKDLDRVKERILEFNNE